MFSLFNFQQCVAVLCFIFFSAVSSQNAPSSKESINQTLTTITERLNNLEKMSKERKEKIVKLQNKGLRMSLAINLLSNLHENKGCQDHTWTLFNGQCYKIYGKFKYSWKEATSICKSVGGHLAEIRDNATNTHLHGLITQLGTQFTVPAYWIGINDAETFGSYVWEGASKPASDYFNWFPFRIVSETRRKNLGYRYGVMFAWTGTWILVPDAEDSKYPLFCQNEPWTIGRTQKS